MPKDKKQKQIDPFVAKPQTVKAPTPLPKTELGIEAITKKKYGLPYHNSEHPWLKVYCGKEGESDRFLVTKSPEQSRMTANDWELLIAYIGRYKPDTLLIEWIFLPPNIDDILGRILNFKCIKTLDLGGSYFFSTILDTTTLNCVAKLLASDDTVTALRLSCIIPSEPVTAATPLNLHPGVDMESVIMMIAGNSTLKKLKLKFRDREANQYRIVKAVMQSYSEIEVLYVVEPPPEHIQKPPKNGLEMDFDLLAEYLGVALINRKLSIISFQGGLKFCHKKDVPITFNSPEYYSPDLFSSPSPC